MTRVFLPFNTNTRHTNKNQVNYIEEATAAAAAAAVAAAAAAAATGVEWAKQSSKNTTSFPENPIKFRLNPLQNATKNPRITLITV